MDRSLISTSKFLSLVLRHRPETIDLELDPQGWVTIDELLAAARRAGRPISRELLTRVVRENDKRRFAISDDQLRIRASQGHSVDVDLGLDSVEPPGELFHGTVKKFLRSIRQQGLKPRSRQHVHLSPDVETATAVGNRRGEAIILIVASGRMHAEGFAFYLSANGVWLTDHVPSGYIRFPDD